MCCSEIRDMKSKAVVVLAEGKQGRFAAVKEIVLL